MESRARKPRFMPPRLEMLGLIFSFPPIAGADQQLTLNLDQATQRALHFSPEIRETQYDGEVYQSKKHQVDAAFWPQIELLGVGGPSNRARGNQVHSPDRQTDLNIDGVFGRADISLVQPLYSFGKISSLGKAAQHGIKYSEAKVNHGGRLQEREEVDGGCILQFRYGNRRHHGLG